MGDADDALYWGFISLFQWDALGDKWSMRLQNGLLRITSDGQFMGIHVTDDISISYFSVSIASVGRYHSEEGSLFHRAYDGYRWMGLRFYDQEAGTSVHNLAQMLLHQGTGAPVTPPRLPRDGELERAAMDDMPALEPVPPSRPLTPPLPDGSTPRTSTLLTQPPGSVPPIASQLGLMTPAEFYRASPARPSPDPRGFPPFTASLLDPTTLPPFDRGPSLSIPIVLPPNTPDENRTFRPLDEDAAPAHSAAMGLRGADDAVEPPQRPSSQASDEANASTGSRSTPPPPLSPVPSPEHSPFTSAERVANLVSSAVNTVLSPASTAVPECPASLVPAVATHSYLQTQPQELSFLEGDVVFGVPLGSTQGLRWHVFRDGDDGMAHMTNLCPLEEYTADEATEGWTCVRCNFANDGELGLSGCALCGYMIAETDDPDPHPGIPRLFGNQSVATPFPVTARCDFTPSKDTHEIGLRAGDKGVVRHMVNGDWWIVEMYGLVGYAPAAWLGRDSDASITKQESVTGAPESTTTSNVTIHFPIPHPAPAPAPAGKSRGPLPPLPASAQSSARSSFSQPGLRRSTRVKKQVQRGEANSMNVPLTTIPNHTERSPASLVDNDHDPEIEELVEGTYDEWPLQPTKRPRVNRVSELRNGRPGATVRNRYLPPGFQYRRRQKAPPARPWNCGACTYENLGTAVQCIMCCSPRMLADPADPDPEPVVVAAVRRKWKCDVCKFTNDGTREVCAVCLLPDSFIVGPVALKPAEVATLPEIEVKVAALRAACATSMEDNPFGEGTVAVDEREASGTVTDDNSGADPQVRLGERGEGYLATEVMLDYDGGMTEGDLGTSEWPWEGPGAPFQRSAPSDDEMAIARRLAQGLFAGQASLWALAGPPVEPALEDAREGEQRTEQGSGTGVTTRIGPQGMRPLSATSAPAPSLAAAFDLSERARTGAGSVSASGAVLSDHSDLRSEPGPTEPQVPRPSCA